MNPLPPPLCRSCGYPLEAGNTSWCAGCGMRNPTIPIVQLVDDIFPDAASVPLEYAAAPSPPPLPTEIGQFKKPLDPEVQHGLERDCLRHLTHSQRLLFGLISQSLHQYNRDWIYNLIGFGLIPFFLMTGVVLAWLAIAAGALILRLLEFLEANGISTSLYLVPIFLFMCAKSFLDLGKKPKIDLLLNEHGQAKSIRLGRLEEAFSAGANGGTDFSFGVVFGSQFALLYFTGNHCFLDIDGGFWQCFWLTFDNLCHDLFLSTFELYPLCVGEAPKHGFLSSTIFMLFRLSFDALAVLFGYSLYLRFRMRGIFKTLPPYVYYVSDFTNWVEAACADERKWPRYFFDEFAFLILSKEYLHCKFDGAETIARQFPWLPIHSHVRDLFQTPQGDPMFPGPPPKLY